MEVRNKNNRNKKNIPMGSGAQCPRARHLSLLLLLLSLPLLGLLLYGRQRRAMGDRRWAAVSVAATGDGGQRAMVMGGGQRAIGDGWLAAGDGDGSRLCCR